MVTHDLGLTTAHPDQLSYLDAEMEMMKGKLGGCQGSPGPASASWLQKGLQWTSLCP